MSLTWFIGVSVAKAQLGIAARTASLYALVDRADSLAERSFRTFYLEKFRDDDTPYRETWRYSDRDGQVFYFQVEYYLDSILYTESYYLHQQRLICTEEYEQRGLSDFEDQLRWGAVFYFQNGVPRHVAILGRRAESGSRQHPVEVALHRFGKRWHELKRHLPMLPY